MKFIILTLTSIFINSYLNAQSWINVNTITTDWNNYPGNGEFKVNPITWEVQDNYVFYKDNFKSTPHIYFKGRKIQ